MKPIAFEVIRNGRRICTAGLAGRSGVISTIISWVDRQGHDQLSLHVGGLDSAAEEHVTWIGRSLRLGDEVAVRLVENAKPSRVRERQKVAPRAKEEKAWLRRTAKKYGYRLVKD